MNNRMASLARAPFMMSTNTVPRLHIRTLNLLKSSNSVHLRTFPHIQIKSPPVCCTKLSSWDPSSDTYAPTDSASDNFLNKTTNIFETLSSATTAEAPDTNSEKLNAASNQTGTELQVLKWPMWLLGPSFLLLTGMLPTLWLPLSSIFLGPNIASLLALVGLDCIFNLGATLFLLMADSIARPKTSALACKSKPPFSYKFWNIVATVTGFIIPLMMAYGSQQGFLQPQLPPISFAVLLGPYLLLIAVQILTEMLTWNWQSPVWLVTPVVYEGYRLLQLMRGLKLGTEIIAPAWMMHTIRGLVSWWVLILGMQLMRVAWFAGFASRYRQQPSPPGDT
ncbi:hypothetical protein RchiOBHm_Chr1g0349101 [Rosa chinensis]|uniref:Cytochrome P450 family protein n=1 Tax=Rosa chinensis TaxID=74649 RepID=A0A2P6SFQ6_ROSCH|nr:uncharacterized protein LOC112181833 [Rosa chinensis]XP_024175996.1 uncharacterized protein LOC112181833 [Rosa chinensis]PRQ57508.1 hypothetical protein RchiOBHm_Chr1g0349101 [Rosa chinensis]